MACKLDLAVVNRTETVWSAMKQGMHFLISLIIAMAAVMEGFLSQQVSRPEPILAASAIVLLLLNPAGLA